MNYFRPFGRIASVALVGMLTTSSLDAQSVSPIDTSRGHQTLFTAADALLGVGFAGLTVAMFPLDKAIARHLQHDTLASSIVGKAATGFELLSVPGAYLIGPALYAYGRLGDHTVIEDLGWHSTEAVLL